MTLTPLARLSEHNETILKLLSYRDEINIKLAYVRRKLVALRVCLHRYGSSPVMADKRAIAERQVDQLIAARMELKSRLAELSVLLKHERACSKRAQALVLAVAPVATSQPEIKLDPSPLDDEIANILGE